MVDSGPWNLNTLPILPQKWEWKVKAEHQQQYNKIAFWLERVKTVVIATDPDEEGEVIGRQILSELGFKGNIKRLWVSALDPNSLKQALGNLLPLSATDTAYRAGCVRRQLDWLYGINLSRALSISSGQRTSVGRVTTKLLTELVKREMEIRRFKPIPYYTATARFGDAVLEWQRENGHDDIPRLPANGEITGLCIAASESLEILEPPLPLTLSALLEDAADNGIDITSGYVAVQKLYEAGADQLSAYRIYSHAAYRQHLDLPYIMPSSIPEILALTGCQRIATAIFKMVRLQLRAAGTG